ncbi:hypothetical protein [Phenylobacterium sp.]|uniref:hypothetical protein n=1 Tax=Phenylobacterium sp. TaxID=1871053 RepID=UPI002F93EC4E
MVRVRYTGITQAKEAFDALRPFHGHLVRLQTNCRPFGPDYMILDAVKKALSTAAYHFTGEPDFFALKPPRS